MACDRFKLSEQCTLTFQYILFCFLNPSVTVISRLFRSIGCAWQWPHGNEGLVSHDAPMLTEIAPPHVIKELDEDGFAPFMFSNYGPKFNHGFGGRRLSPIRSKTQEVGNVLDCIFVVLNVWIAMMIHFRRFFISNYLVTFLVLCVAGANAFTHYTTYVDSPITLYTEDAIINGDNGDLFLWMRADGNLVLYDYLTVPIWHTNTIGYTNAEFHIQGDGNLVLYEDNSLTNALWYSGTSSWESGPYRLSVLQHNMILHDQYSTPMWSAMPMVSGALSQCNEALTGIGYDYRGCQTTTRLGYTCQYWTDQSPHTHTMMVEYPNAALGPHHFCRNPDGDDTIWCYTTDSEKRLDFCDPMVTSEPTHAPTPGTPVPTPYPTRVPTNDPTPAPTINPSSAPSASPSAPPSNYPSNYPSQNPTFAPILAPTVAPSLAPTHNPTQNPTTTPSLAPSLAPTFAPTMAPTFSPSLAPSHNPTLNPTHNPTHNPTQPPTSSPTLPPSSTPSIAPSNAPSNTPSRAPSNAPSNAPSPAPSNAPSNAPSRAPSNAPSKPPSNAPTQPPTGTPSAAPSLSPIGCFDLDPEYNSNEGKNEYDVDSIANDVTFTYDTSMIVNVTGIAAKAAEDMHLNASALELQCHGIVSCFRTHIYCARNQPICNILCDGYLSCSQAVIYANRTQHVHMICDGDEACASAQLYTRDTVNQVTVDCVSPSSCNALHVSLKDNGYNLISCYLSNACDGVHLYTTTYNTTKLVMYSHSDNIVLDNEYGLLKDDHEKDKQIDCATDNKYVRYHSELTQTQIESSVLNEYSNNLFPCSGVTIRCDTNGTLDRSCSIQYAIRSITPPMPAPQCYWVSVTDLVHISCPGTCLHSPTETPTKMPSFAPTQTTIIPTNAPSNAPTLAPSQTPTGSPTTAPSVTPTLAPSIAPTQPPSSNPSLAPTGSPSSAPTQSPTRRPTLAPSLHPTNAPSQNPSTAPSLSPTASPSNNPTRAPSQSPTKAPIISPTTAPSLSPSNNPTSVPTLAPTVSPSFSPSANPTSAPSQNPSRTPTSAPSSAPTFSPSLAPTHHPTHNPTQKPTAAPTLAPSLVPSTSPTAFPSSAPSTHPSNYPSHTPTSAPSIAPSFSPSLAPTHNPTHNPTQNPTSAPTLAPSFTPTIAPTSAPTIGPTYSPSQAPTRGPTQDTAFPYWVDIVYELRGYTEDNLQFIVSDSVGFIEEMQSICEMHYFPAVSRYGGFVVEINAVNDVLVDRGERRRRLQEEIEEKQMSIELNIDDLYSFELQQPIQLASQVRTEDGDIAGSIITTSKALRFSTQVQKDVRSYFSNDQITFSINNADALTALDEIPPPPDPTQRNLVIVSILVVFVGFIISMAALAVNKKKDSKVDNAAFAAPILVSLQIYDLMSDLYLCIEILSKDEMVASVSNPYFVCGISILSFTVLPWFSNLYYAVTLPQQKVIKQNTAASTYFKNKLKEFVILVCFTGGCYPSLALVSSRIFSLDAFNCGLTKYELFKLSKIKLKSTILLENGPQLILQFIYLTFNGVDAATVMASTASLLSVIATLAAYYAERSSNQSETDKVVQYALHFCFNDSSKRLADKESAAIRQRKERKGELSRRICKEFEIEQNTIEIGYIKVVPDGYHMDMVHYVLEEQLKKYSRKQLNRMQGVTSQVEPIYYVRNLCLQHRDQLTTAMCEHFGLDNAKRFTVKFVNDETDDVFRPLGTQIAYHQSLGGAYTNVQVDGVNNNAKDDGDEEEKEVELVPLHWQHPADSSDKIESKIQSILSMQSEQMLLIQQQTQLQISELLKLLETDKGDTPGGEGGTIEEIGE
eukprot:1055756_1